MKILYLITKSNMGGAQRYVLDLATRMHDDGHEAVVACGGNGVLVSSLAKAGVPVRTIERLGRDIRLFDEIAVFFTLIRMFAAERPHVVHLNSSKIGGIGALAARMHNVRETLKTKDKKRKTKIVFTAHGWAFNEPRGVLTRALIRFLSWLTIVLSHTVITVSAYDRDAVAHWPLAKERVRVIHNGGRFPDLLPRSEARAAISEVASAPIPETVPWIGTIAELTPNKGYIYAIEAMAELSRTHSFVYIIIGSGEQYEQLQELITQYNLEGTVFLLGTDLEGNASRHLRAFDIFLLPSVKEGLPYTLIEAGYAEVPVVASAVGGIPEVIADEHTGLLTSPKDPEHIARALSSLIRRDTDGRSALAEALYRRVADEFSLDTMYRHTREHYRS